MTLPCHHPENEFLTCASLTDLLYIVVPVVVQERDEENAGCDGPNGGEDEQRNVQVLKVFFALFHRGFLQIASFA
jgi:hypothetical protein